MKKIVHIVNAYLYGLDNDLQYDEEKKCYYWPLSFIGVRDEQSPEVYFYFVSDYKLSYKTKKIFRKSFSKARIKDGEKILIVYTDSGIINAIQGDKSGLWIDLNDGYKVKHRINYNADIVKVHP